MRFHLLFVFLLALVGVNAICPSICEDTNHPICAKEETADGRVFAVFRNLCLMHAANECNDRCRLSFEKKDLIKNNFKVSRKPKSVASCPKLIEQVSGGVEVTTHNTSGEWLKLVMVRRWTQENTMRCVAHRGQMPVIGVHHGHARPPDWFRFGAQNGAVSAVTGSPVEVRTHVTVNTPHRRGRLGREVEPCCEAAVKDEDPVFRSGRFASRVGSILKTIHLT
ncbi:hypothetical protein AAG570_002239 [Ranatra chinensis]|uniref:Uncharacterized protein n=1 Tax=Ranatra chinensis TaxID=642074 RepID=A0ABD0Y7C9_9HEMI